MSVKIAALSDFHGDLIKINPCDIVIISGDISPLHIQRNVTEMTEWFTGEFAEWVRNIPCDKVFLVAGNHDFMFEYLTRSDIDMLIRKAQLDTKLIYLMDECYTYKDKLIYGTPWCVGPARWAFCPNYRDTNPMSIEKHYNDIPEECDILITHQPPMVDTVGCSYPGEAWQREFGSASLAARIRDRKVKYSFCGHIHSGTHNGVAYEGSTIYNVSIKDEDYEINYPVTYIEV